MKRKQSHYITILFFIANILITQFTYGQYPLKNQLQKEIQDTLSKSINRLTSHSKIGNEHLCSSDAVIKYYVQNDYNPSWVNNNGVTGLCDSLINLIKQSYFEGLAPENYHLSHIENMYKYVKNMGRTYPGHEFDTCFNLEILLTDAFLTYISDLYAGHIHTKSQNVEWKDHIAEISLSDSLKKAVENNRIAYIVNNLSCSHPGYIALKNLLRKYIYKNQHYGSETPPGFEDSLNTVILNMERWRWLPHTMNQPYIMVNIAGFNMNVIDGNKSILDMKIIVGKKYTRTPLFHAKMTYLVINPWWEIPVSIARKEIVKDIKKHKDYLDKKHIKVYENWSLGAREISASSINWDSISPGKVTYRFRQEPGSDNALGHIKFIFPNKYNIYLHDTPVPQLFLKERRTFSHGCIRIEKPMELAEYLLKGDSNWTEQTLLESIDAGKNEIVMLPKPLSVYICYWTAWLNPDGQAYFQPDIYLYDKKLLQLMIPSSNEGE